MATDALRANAPKGSMSLMTRTTHNTLRRKRVGQQEQLPAGQEFLMAPRRLLARRGQVEKLLTLHGVLGLFGELSIFLRFDAKVVDVLHAMVSHLSGARVATQPTRRSMTRKHESCTSGLMQI